MANEGRDKAEPFGGAEESSASAIDEGWQRLKEVFDEVGPDIENVRSGVVNPRSCLQVYALRSTADRFVKAIKELEGHGKQLLEAFLTEQQQQKVRLETAIGPRTASLRPYRRAWVRKADVSAALDFLQSVADDDVLGEHARRAAHQETVIDQDELLQLIDAMNDLGRPIPEFLNHEDGVNVGFTGR